MCCFSSSIHSALWFIPGLNPRDAIQPGDLPFFIHYLYVIVSVRMELLNPSETHLYFPFNPLVKLPRCSIEVLDELLSPHRGRKWSLWREDKFRIGSAMAEYNFPVPTTNPRTLVGVLTSAF